MTFSSLFLVYVCGWEKNLIGNEDPLTVPALVVGDDSFQLADTGFFQHSLLGSGWKTMWPSLLLFSDGVEEVESLLLSIGICGVF